MSREDERFMRFMYHIPDVHFVLTEFKSKREKKNYTNLVYNSPWHKEILKINK